MEVGEGAFAEHRELLFGVAYRVLGRVVDAEDVVQECWLRWAKVDPAEVGDARAFLLTVVTRLSVDRLRRVRARRESYVGEWLPEPVPTIAGPDGLTDPAEYVVRAESVSLALLVVLESLSPLERAVFVLREVFAFGYPEIARLLDRREAAVRQLAVRARAHVRERRPRFEVDPLVWRRLTDRFAAACLEGRIEGVMELLAPDVRLVADSGGNAVAPRRVIVGPEPVARFVLQVMRLRKPFLSSVGVDGDTQTVEYRLVEANAGPALQVTADGRPIVHFQLQVADGRVVACHLVVNPEKLGAVMSQDGAVLRL
ncbi:RNA polymerase sigma factor SigJ [Actinomadura flavalba]|uniref:RNA polymerase sigma factor SigJ n=1 Tax=Actinomadura flavalba TaxID=1120938 RepID=UPI0003751340|nr:RNA polymerase sigma factor SigJ [Actinomadura flavalba]